MPTPERPHRAAILLGHHGSMSRAERTTYGITFCMDGVEWNAVVAASSL
jgi:hypothetical protein